MNEFTPISLKHKALFNEIYGLEQSQSSGDSFGNVYLWDLLCRRNIARLGDRIGVEYMCPRGIFYAFPSGSGPLAPAIEALRLRALSHGCPLVIWGMTPDQRQQLEAAFPDCFEYTDDRDNYDYIYDVNAMATLAGKKLHGKRNFCNRFEGAHNWRFQPLSPALFGDCRMLLNDWESEHHDPNDEENQAIDRVFQDWDGLGMVGGVLYAEDAPVAFSIGELLRPDTMDVHFEKAHNDVPGAYPMIAREFARYVLREFPSVRYLNREEDMGIENLRRAKEEWYPLFLLEKTTAVWKEKE